MGFLTYQIYDETSYLLVASVALPGRRQASLLGRQTEIRQGEVWEIAGTFDGSRLERVVKSSWEMEVTQVTKTTT